MRSFFKLKFQLENQTTNVKQLQVTMKQLLELARSCDNLEIMYSNPTLQEVTWQKFWSSNDLTFCAFDRRINQTRIPDPWDHLNIHNESEMNYHEYSDLFIVTWSFYNHMINNHVIKNELGSSVFQSRFHGWTNWRQVENCVAFSCNCFVINILSRDPGWNNITWCVTWSCRGHPSTFYVPGT